MFTQGELVILLDAVMSHYRMVSRVPLNDGTNLPEIEELQHKVERLLTTGVT